MAAHSDARMNAVFQALSDSTRRAMVTSLFDRDLTVSELAAPHDMTLAAISKHVKVLEAAGLVSRTIQGRNHICHLEAERLADAELWLSRYTRYWHERLEALDALFPNSDE